MRAQTYCHIILVKRPRGGRLTSCDDITIKMHTHAYLVCENTPWADLENIISCICMSCIVFAGGRLTRQTYVHMSMHDHKEQRLARMTMRIYLCMFTCIPCGTPIHRQEHVHLLVLSRAEGSREADVYAWDVSRYIGRKMCENTLCTCIVSVWNRYNKTVYVLL
jgi:hypothetical protein